MASLRTHNNRLRRRAALAYEKRLLRDIFGSWGPRHQSRRRRMIMRAMKDVACWGLEISMRDLAVVDVAVGRNRAPAGSFVIESVPAYGDGQFDHYMGIRPQRQITIMFDSPPCVGVTIPLKRETTEC